MNELNELEYTKEDIDAVSMAMILHAGNARLLIEEALNEVGKFNIDTACKLMEEASEEIKTAHIHQTKIIQGQACGIEYDYSILFTHAQDTVMTINSEFNITQHIISNYKILNARLLEIESKIK